MNNDKELIKKMVAVCEEHDDEYDVHQVMQAVADVAQKHFQDKHVEAVTELHAEADKWDAIEAIEKSNQGVNDE